jgi:PST family polysaccharide transporter
MKNRSKSYISKFVNGYKNRSKRTAFLFKVDHLKYNLKDRTVRGGTVTVFAQIVKFSFRILSTVILARLLTPQDFGLVAMVTAITLFAEMFKDMGLSMATVQKKKIDNEEISTLFWINQIFSVSIFLLTVCFSPLIAWYYEEPKLVWVTIGISFGFIFGGLTVQHQALLRRQMQFFALAIIEIIALLLGIIVGVVLSFNGFEYWSLVWMHLSTSLAIAIGTWIMCPWYPAWIMRINKVRSMLAFGGNLTGFNIINYFARNIDNVLIGRFFGAQQLGFYSKAYSLLLLPLKQINAPITAVAIPALSRLADSPVRYRRTYLRILEKITILTMPGMVFLIINSDWLVSILLGPQWNETSLIFSILGFVALIQPIANTTGWLFITQNRTGHMVQWGFIGGTLSILAIILGLPWGTIGVAASYSISGIFQFPLLIWFVCKEGPIRSVDFYRTLTPALCASLLVAVLLVIFRKLEVISIPVIGVILAISITVLSTLLILGVLPSGRKALSDFISLIDSLYRRPKASKKC